MRSLNRKDGRSGGVCSVASPDSIGMTCREGSRCREVYGICLRQGRDVLGPEGGVE